MNKPNDNGRNGGFIALARGALGHPVVGATKPYSDFEAWVWLLFEAAWKPRRVRVSNGRSASVVDLQRGQLSHSLSYMAEAWGWSIKRVRTFLDRLEMDRQITRQKGTAQNVITICNYERFQNPNPDKGTQTGTQTGSQWARNGHEEEQGNKETSNNREERTSAPRRARSNAEPDGFDDWYRGYPRKKQRKDAAKAFAKLVPNAISLADLIERTRVFAAHWAARGGLKFCPYPASWLNSGEYLDTPTHETGDNANVSPNAVSVAAARHVEFIRNNFNSPPPQIIDGTSNPVGIRGTEGGTNVRLLSQGRR